ncbi:nucleotidyltransferase domain-containing protein [Nocardioides okcheonensis]|uniref:nucleotidyltransferase domain-containing protein n=1 Tax=Nocardioides okcheonensis TaxID=2894081 RepID=UPI001E3589AA|nr:hypothetical protein [Nocardioides okcheonensis]UFN45886.1 hypothetical protein LN652_06665 [Nocardioides okcheonensis]
MHWTPSEDDEAEQAAFERLWGAWRALDPAGLKDFMADYDREWWVVGGWAIDAFTGQHRPHDDIDAVIWRRDLPRLRELVGERHHVWAAGSGMIRPVTDEWPEPHPGAGQVWLRDHALAPWFLDCLLSEDMDGLWVSRRDPDHVAPLADVTWVADDGIRYMRPEVVLHHKARPSRTKDAADLAVAWPLLGATEQDWLREAVRRERADHPWLERMALAG